MNDNWKKAIFAICGTVLILLYAILKFGGFYMKYSINSLAIAIAIGGILLGVFVGVFGAILQEGCNKDICMDCLYFKLSDDEKNKTFIVSKDSDCANKDQEIIIVKKGIELTEDNIPNYNIVKKIYFADEIRIRSDLYKNLHDVELGVVNRDLICDYEKRLNKLNNENEILKQKIEELKQSKKYTDD